MLLAPRHGFAFLAVHKTGSTAIERAFRPHARVTQRRDPALKHTSLSEFQRFLQPWLEARGFLREFFAPGYDIYEQAIGGPGSGPPG